MKYDLSRIAPQEPRNANERIASLRRRGHMVVELETRPNGDVLVALRRGNFFVGNYIVPADGSRITTRVEF